MAQTRACKLSPMLEVPDVRADVACRYLTTQGTDPFITHSLAAVLHLNLSLASGLKAQDASK